MYPMYLKYRMNDADLMSDKKSWREEEDPAEADLKATREETRRQLHTKFTSNYSHRAPISLFGSSTVLDCLEPTIGSFSTLSSGSNPTCCNTLAWSQ